MTTTLPYHKLVAMPDQEVQSIWDAINTPRCCDSHFPPDQEVPLDEVWAMNVLAEVERRELRVELPPAEPFNCPDCQTPFETVSAELGPDAFAVCHNCKNRRKFGDHQNCSLGDPEDLPEA